MMRVSLGSIERHFSILLIALGLVACGGKKEITFVGAPNSGDAGAGNMPGATCGDGVVDSGEECDDGAHAKGDGCSASCAVEDGWTCSGAPSVCVKCGNGVVEPGEDCDDGNTDVGDGCDASCKIEGSCAGPIPIELKADKDGLVGTVTSATNKSEMGQVPAADCGGAMVGGGADRVFEFELKGSADLDVSVGSNFDAVLRLTTMPCDLTTAVGGGCSDQGAVAAEEAIHIDSAPAGKYYVVVDGKTAQQAGSFSVNVAARCPLDGLKIERVIVSEPFRTVLLNTNPSCSIDLSRVGVYAQPEAADGPKTLPAVTLDPLKPRLLTSESPPPNGTTYQGNIPYDSDGYAGAFYLCRGECALPKGSNVFDAVRWNGDSGKPKAAPLTTVTFDANLPALADRAKMSFYRVATQSTPPRFAADDWVGAYFADGFEDGSFLGWDAGAALFYSAKFAPVKGTLGAFSLELDGGNPAASVWNGPKFSFKDNAGMPAALQPSYVSLRVRGGDKALSHGWAFFGNPGAEASGFGSFFRENGTIAFGAGAPLFASYQLDTWYLIEYQNFDYTAQTVEVFLNGKSQGKLPMTLPAGKTISQLSLRSLAPKASAWFDQIVVR